MEPPNPGSLDATQTVNGGTSPSIAFGSYRLLQRIGEGGMGEVWHAEQVRPVRRQVALKIIKAGMDTARVIARFEAERQALALMDHPAIATVFDGGSTPEGRPYFAMEYVKGEPITTYCDRHRLGTRGRLELFIRVCEGVQHAHQKGIIHRDLKPSNVLVTLENEQPAPKIIDFGVAKAMTQHLTERTLFTEVGALIGTPEYMSPEQAEQTGLDVDTRTDVYALGVLLYELLTGTLPFGSRELRARGLDEIRRTIREMEPPRPSTRITQQGPASAEAATNRRTEPARLASQLRGDLDWITMKAIEKDRTRRYDTVMGLANDVSRHLRDEPVTAGPPSTVYRLGKFVRRHRFGVGAAAVLVVLLITFGVAMALQAQRISRERDRANREAQTAKQVSSFLVTLFETSKPSEAAADSVTARQILDKGAEQIRNQLRGQPEVRAALFTAIGEAYRSLGVYQQAERLLEEGLRLRRQTATVENEELGHAMVALGDVHMNQARFAEAERLYREALELFRRSPAVEQASLANALVGLSYALDGQTKPVEAERVSREAVAIYRRMPDAPPRRLAEALASLGVVLHETKPHEAERVLTEALEIHGRALGRRHPQTLADLFTLASLWSRRREYARAEAAYRDILAADRAQKGPEHPDVGGSLNNLGAMLFWQHKYAEAEDAYREALAIRRKALGPAHPRVARALRNLGEALDAQGRYGEAHASLREALAIDRKALGSDDPSVGLNLVYLSATLRHMRRFPEAEAAAREALGIDIKRLGAEHRRTKEAGCNLGMALAKQRRWSEAEPLLLPCGRGFEAEVLDGDYGEVVEEIVRMYEAWGKLDEAAEWRRKLPKQVAGRQE